MIIIYPVDIDKLEQEMFAATGLRCRAFIDYEEDLVNLSIPEHEIPSAVQAHDVFDVPPGGSPVMIPIPETVIVFEYSRFLPREELTRMAVRYCVNAVNEWRKRKRGGA